MKSRGCSARRRRRGVRSFVHTGARAGGDPCRPRSTISNAVRPGCRSAALPACNAAGGTHCGTAGQRPCDTRSSFSSRIPVCQSGDAGAIPAGRTISHTRRAPACAAESPKFRLPGASPGRRAIFHRGLRSIGGPLPCKQQTPERNRQAPPTSFGGQQASSRRLTATCHNFHGECPGQSAVNRPSSNRPEATSGALPPFPTTFTWPVSSATKSTRLSSGRAPEQCRHGPPFSFPGEVKQPAGLLNRSSWCESMPGSHFIYRMRGSQRTRLTWDQESSGGGSREIDCRQAARRARRLGSR